MKKSRILDYILITAALPIMVWMELNEASQDISLALTGGKYSGWGRLNRKRYRDDDDEATDDWLRPPDYDSGNFRQAISRAKRLKYLEKRLGPNDMPELVLTKEGEAKVLKRFPLLKLARRLWQGLWLVVAFDIPESDKKTRNFIRRQLTGVGFAQWQKSVYVCPHDIADDLHKMLKDNGLENKVVPMIAKRILAGSDWEFARRVFHIDKIETEYRRIVESLADETDSSENRADRLRRQFARFVEVVKSDPLLPVGLAPKTGYGREAAMAALKKYASGLKPTPIEKSR
jgi:DNA-binding transcriptional regulator PaaX